MLCIIFTKKKAFAAIYGEKIELLPLSNENYTSYSGTLKEALEAHLPSISAKYSQHLLKAGKKALDPIPLVIVYPSDNSDAQKDEERHAKQWIKSFAPGFRLVHTDKIATAYLQHMLPNEEQFNNDCIVLEALDDYVNLYIHYGNRTKKGYYKTIKELGWQEGKRTILEKLVMTLAQEGFILNEEDEAALVNQLEHHKEGEEFIIRKKTAGVVIDAKVHLPDASYKDLICKGRSSLDDLLKINLKTNKYIYKVFLIGKYFDNTFFLNYLCDHLNLQGKLISKNISTNEQAIIAIATGVFEKTIAVYAAKKAKSVAQHQQKHHRKQLLKEILDVCTDRSKFKEYNSIYITKGAAIGIPKSVILWLIKENLSADEIHDPFIDRIEGLTDPAQKITPSEHTKVTVKASSSSDIEKAPTNTEKQKNIPTPTPKQPEEKTSQQQTNGLANKVSTTNIEPQDQKETQEKNHTTLKVPPLKSKSNKKALAELGQYLSIEKMYTDTEFMLFKGKLKGNEKLRVFRVIMADTAKDKNEMKRFRSLHDLESSYYNDKISSIYTMSFGRFYHRDFIQGTTLRNYITQNGINQKQGVTDLKTDELQLILALWKEINGLKIACKNLNEDNILVSTKRKWNLKKEINIHLVGISSATCSKEEMQEDLHQIFERQLGKGLYQQVRQKFKL